MKLKLMILILITGIFTACERDLEVSEAEFQDFGFITSEFRNEQLTVGIDNFITFNDLSINPLEHTWTISEGSVFLKGPITRNDTIFDDFIIPDAGLVSTDKTVNVLFTESGIQPVNLRNVFTDSVAFRTSNGVIPAIREENLWVIDTTLLVDVYDTIVPIIDIRRPDDTPVPFMSEDDIIEIEAGDFLKFVDLSTKDRVTNRAWRIENNGFVEDSVGIFIFKRLGEFKGVADLSRRGENIPPDFERFEIPATFRVIPSSQPFVVIPDGIVELENEVIQIPFNGEFAPFGAQEEFFTVMLLNDTGANPVRELSIESVAISLEDASRLEITLSEPIFRPDMITVSYDGNGSLQSTDTRNPVAFSDLPVAMHSVSAVPEESLAIYDFEGFDADVAWNLKSDNVGGAIEISDERASSGNTSLKVTGSGGTIRFISNESINVPNGDYIITFDIYIEPGATNFNAAWPSIQTPFFQQWRDARAGAVPRGEWVTISSTNTISGGEITSPFIRLEPNPVGVAYIDNWKLLTKEERP